MNQHTKIKTSAIQSRAANNCGIEPLKKNIPFNFSDKPVGIFSAIIGMLGSQFRRKEAIPDERCHIGFIGNIPEPKGGAELFLLNLISHLSKMPTSLTLIRWQKQIMNYEGAINEVAYREKEVIELDDYLNLKIHFLFNPTPGWLIPKILRIMRLAIKTADSLRNGGTQIIHCHLLIPNIYFAFIASRLLKIPLIVTIHGLVDLTQPGHIVGRRYAAIENRILIKILKKCNCVISVSNEIMQYCKTLGLQNLELQSCGIDTEYFCPAPGEDRGILFIGNLTNRKGFDLLLQAFAQVRNNVSEPLYLAGKNPTGYNSGNDPDIVHLGVLSQADLRHAIQRSKLIVLPSRSEGLPLSVLEAMSCNKPVLVTPVGELAHLIVDGQNGYFCKLGSVDSLANRIEEILSNYDHCKTSLGLKPRLSAQEFDIRRITQWHWQLYIRILGTTGRQVGLKNETY